MILRRVAVAAAIFWCVAASAGEPRYELFDQSPAVSREVIAHAANAIRTVGVRHVVVVGHADTAPMALSRFRAQAVATELRRGGVFEGGL